MLRHTEPAVRPDDVLAGLVAVAGQGGGLGGGSSALLTRVAQGPLDPATGAVGDPLA
ncbi:MAG: hypothetical protein R2731_12910 [Nocardioides sp.]